ncbi:MAG: MFS transporter, partial [Candidatus Limnocylindrales bacterium]
MTASLLAALGGTFLLRMASGLTAAMLVYYLADLPRHGGAEVSALTVGALTAAFYAAELLLSPIFGILSDRFGHHRLMQVGPLFGAVAVAITAITTDLTVLGGTRLLEGASAAVSVPSILGYLAVATVGDEGLRGRAAARRSAYRRCRRSVA